MAPMMAITTDVGIGAVCLQNRAQLWPHL